MNLLPVDFHCILRPSPMVKGNGQANLREQFRSILGVTHDICWTQRTDSAPLCDRRQVAFGKPWLPADMARMPRRAAAIAE